MRWATTAASAIGLTLLTGCSMFGGIPASSGTPASQASSPSSTPTSQHVGAKDPPPRLGWRLGPVAPGVERRPRHTEQVTHERDRVVGPLRLDQRAALGYGAVLAKKAAAFFRNSF